MSPRHAVKDFNQGFSGTGAEDIVTEYLKENNLDDEVSMNQINDVLKNLKFDALAIVSNKVDLWDGAYIDDCLFCKIKHNGIGPLPSIEIIKKDQKEFYVTCRNCYCTGPVKYSASLALDSWNFPDRNV